MSIGTYKPRPLPPKGPPVPGEVLEPARGELDFPNLTSQVKSWGVKFAASTPPRAGAKPR